MLSQLEVHQKMVSAAQAEREQFMLQILQLEKKVHIIMEYVCTYIHTCTYVHTNIIPEITRYFTEVAVLSLKQMNSEKH